MFSDRFWLAKLLVAILLFGSLCIRSRREFSERYPDFSASALPGGKAVGKTVHITAEPVAALLPDGFEIISGAGPIRILSAERPPLGQTVSVVGEIVGDRTVRSNDLQINEGYAWKRTANYAVSLTVFLVFLWLIRPLFRWNLREGILRSRY